MRPLLTIINHTQVLDLETMEFEAGPAMEIARYACAATRLDADRVLVIGGKDNGTYLASTEILGAVDEQETQCRRR